MKKKANPDSKEVPKIYRKHLKDIDIWSAARRERRTNESSCSRTGHNAQN
jgi:hypothetical protein